MQSNIRVLDATPRGNVNTRPRCPGSCTVYSWFSVCYVSATGTNTVNQKLDASDRCQLTPTEPRDAASRQVDRVVRYTTLDAECDQHVTVVGTLLTAPCHVRRRYANGQTDRQTDLLTTVLCTPPGGGACNHRR